MHKVIHSHYRKQVPDYGLSRERNDLGYITFDVKADLTNLFNWNVKQLFLFVTAEYETPNNKLNQVVLWDKVILRGENALLDFKNLNTKYYFWDDGRGLKYVNVQPLKMCWWFVFWVINLFFFTCRGNKNVTLTLSWNIIPNAGLLPNILALGHHSFKFPLEYTTSRA